MNGLVRYIATMSDYVLVLCKAENLVNIKTMYQDNNKIKVVQVKDIYADIAKYNIGNYVDGIEITHTIRTGCWAGYNNFDDIPDCFYYSIGIDKNIRTRFFCLPSNIDQLTVPKIPFVFVQTVSSTTVNDTIITWDLDKTLTIDPNKNLYMKDHPFYDLADTYINKPFFSYINLLESAEQIHLLNSSFQCLSTYLKTQADIRKCYDRDTGIEDCHFTRQINT